MAKDPSSASFRSWSEPRLVVRVFFRVRHLQAGRGVRRGRHVGRKERGLDSRGTTDPLRHFLMPLDSHGVLVHPRRCRPSKPIVRKFPILHITAATSIFDAGAHSLRFFALCQNVSKAWLGILEGGIGSRRSLQRLLCLLLGLPSPDENARPGRPMRDPRRTLTVPMTL